MSLPQLWPVAVIALPLAAFVLWPLLRGREDPRKARAVSPDDRRLELAEDKAAIYRALKELEFDYEAGHLSDDDYGSLRAAYEARAAGVLTALDALGPAAPPAPPPGPSGPSLAARGWTRSPVALAVGATVLVVFGVVLGASIGRFTEPDPTMIAPGSRLAVPVGPGPDPAGPPGAPDATARPIPPEMLAGMLRAARQSLLEGRYQDAIAAYQAVLKRDARNVDALTHLGLIVGIGGHADAALETFDKALAIDPDYAPAYLYRGQLLYEVKRSYAGAITAWERFLALAPPGEERDRVMALVKDARAKQSGR